MGLNYLFDTNIFIYYLNDDPKVSHLFDAKFISNNTVYVSSITRIELLSFPDLNDNEMLNISRLLDEFEIIQINRNIEDSCIDLRKKYNIKTPDALIIATAGICNAVVITSDKDLFKISSDIKIIDPKDVK